MIPSSCSPLERGFSFRKCAARNFWHACNVQRTTRSATNGSQCTTMCDLRHTATVDATRSGLLLLLGLYAFSSVDQRRGVVLPQQGQYTYPVVGNLPLLPLCFCSTASAANPLRSFEPQWVRRYSVRRVCCDCVHVKDNLPAGLRAGSCRVRHPCGDPQA